MFPRSGEIEIFLVLPIGDLGRARAPLGLGVAARDLGLLDPEEVIDEGVAEVGAEQCAGLECRERFGKRLRQSVAGAARRFVGRVGRRPGASLRAMPSRPAQICDAM